MTDLMATRGADCVERLPIGDIGGTVSQFQDTNISVTVNSKQLATKATANLAMDDGDKELPDDAETAQSVTVNGSPIFLVRDDVLSDHDITNGGQNSSITYSPA
jgi:hypothetical protein